MNQRLEQLESKKFHYDFNKCLEAGGRIVPGTYREERGAGGEYYYSVSLTYAGTYAAPARAYRRYSPAGLIQRLLPRSYRRQYTK